MPSKLGFHFDVVMHQDWEAALSACQPAVVKMIHSVEVIQRLYEKLPNTTFIMRHWQVGDDFSRFGGPSDPKGKAREWIDAMRPIMSQLPRERVYWESFNEPNSVSQPYGIFEAERQRLMAGEGFKACIGNFAVGNPQIQGPGDEWPYLYEALEVAHEQGNILGLHEYGGLFMAMWYGTENLNQKWEAQIGAGQKPRIDLYPEAYDEGWLFGRYRKVWNQHLRPRGYTNVRIAITECGLDIAGTTGAALLTHHSIGSFRGLGAAWSEIFPEHYTQSEDRFFVDQLVWADRQMQRDPYVIGATVYTWGTANAAQWAGFDITGPVSEMLVEHIKAEAKRPYPTPAPQALAPQQASKESPASSAPEALSTRPLMPAIDAAKFPGAQPAIAALIDKYRAAANTHPQAFCKAMLSSAASDLDRMLKSGVNAQAVSALMNRWQHAAATHPDADSKEVLEFCIHELGGINARFLSGATPAPSAPPAPAAPAAPVTTGKPSAPAATLSTPGGKPMTGHGLSGITFSVTRPQVASNERIEFRFTVSNNSGAAITLGYAGCAIYDSNGKNAGFHSSWTEWHLEAGKSESWYDGLAIGTPGTYTLVFAFCVPGIEACNAGKGQWFEPVPGVSVRVL